MLRQLVLAAALAVCTIAPAYAQEEEAIVVTGARRSEQYEAVAEMAMPHVTLRKRADSVVVDLYVRNESFPHWQKSFLHIKLAHCRTIGHSLW